MHPLAKEIHGQTITSKLKINAMTYTESNPDN